MSGTQDQELEAFKTEIDLRAYVAAQGYQLDRRESWRGSSVMRHANGDKLIIKKDTDNHFVFFSVRDDAAGSIIDFLKKRNGLNLGQVRKELRPWIGKASSSLPLFPDLPVTSKNRLEVEASFRRMGEALRHPYLETERGLPPALLGSPRFAGRVMIDGYGNAVFPHFDQEGLCGYEIKNKEFTGFARGGEKGLWFSHTEVSDNCLVLAESAIDALSHAALFPAPGTRYASIGGQMNPRQPELIRATILRLPEGAAVVAAMDADDDGRKFSEVVRLAAAGSGRIDLSFRIQEPSIGKDWNDELRARSRPSFPTARLEGA